MFNTRIVVLSMLEQLCYLITEHSVQTLAWKRQGSCSGVGHQEQWLCNSLTSKYQAQSGVARSRLLPQRPRLVSLEARGQKRAGPWGPLGSLSCRQETSQLCSNPSIQRMLETIDMLCAPGELRERLTRVHNLEDSEEGQHTMFVFPTENFKSKNTNCE